jgi:hypothetical protein
MCGFRRSRPEPSKAWIASNNGTIAVDVDHLTEPGCRFGVQVKCGDAPIKEIGRPKIVIRSPHEQRRSRLIKHEPKVSIRPPIFAMSNVVEAVIRSGNFFG